MADKGKGSSAARPGRRCSLELRVAVAKAYLAKQAKAAELAKVYGISPWCVYRWAHDYEKSGEAGLEKNSPAPRDGRVDPVEKTLAGEILATKKKFSWFGIPRIVQWLRRTKLLPVTATQVEKTLKQENLVPKRPKKRRRAEVVRFFERAEPNGLWQTDITMWTMAKGQKVYLIGFLDDHSRYMVGWGLYAAQGSSQVLEVLRTAIGQYGAPKEILSDQGRQFYAWRGKCHFQKELAREGIHHIVSRSHHPQTLGKIEAFWKHLKEEFLSRVVTGSINDLRERLRLWIDSFYNFQRPHQGIEGMAPADRYFKMAQEVKKVIEKGVKENAERLSLGKEPIKPFYMVGRMGDQSIVIQQQGTELVMNVGEQEREKIHLTEEGDEKKESGGTGGRRGSASEGAGPSGAPSALGGKVDQRDLSGDGTQAGAVLQARRPDREGDGDGGAGEPLGRASEKPAGGVEGSGGSQPAAPAGQPPHVGAPAPDQEALQNGGQSPEKGGSEGSASGGSSDGEDREPFTQCT